MSSILMKKFSWYRALAVLQLCLALAAFSQSPCETPGLSPFQDHSKWGYLSGTGIVVAARFDFAGLFTSDCAIACAANEGG